MNKVHVGPVELPNALMSEGVAKAVLKAGNIVVRSGSDLALGVASSVGKLLIAKENGPGVGGNIDDSFAIGDTLDAYAARQGLFFNVRVATGQVLVENETLMERGASGRLVKLASGVAVAVAKTTVTTTANDELVLMEIL